MKRAWVALALLGCVGTETGNPSLTLEYQAHSTDASRAGLRSGEGRVVDAVWLNLGDLDVLGCADERAVAPAIGVGDHATSEAVVQQLVVEPGAYCGAEVRFVRANAAPPGAPASLAGRSGLVVGRRADGAPFEVAIEGDFSVAIDTSSFDLEEGSPPLLLGFDVAAWVGGLDLDSVTPGDDGVVRIDSSATPAVHSAFEADFGSGVGLYQDLDADEQPDGDPLLGTGS